MVRNIIILRLLVTRRGKREERGRGERREGEGQGGGGESELAAMKL